MGTAKGRGPSRGQKRRDVPRAGGAPGDARRGEELTEGQGCSVAQSPSWVQERGWSESRTFFLKSGHLFL